VTNEYLVEVFISLKEVVNDPQGLAIRDGLHNLGFPEVESVRTGKYLRLSVLADSSAQAHERVSKACEMLLANTIIEEFRIAVGETAKG
jgi:phosphoribosylformylglycinamidine synthase subunit PurS